MTEEAEIFREEASELLDDIEETLLQLKKEPANQDLINKLFRAAHTIKGSGAMFGFTEVSGFTHKFENAIDASRQGRVTLNDSIISTFLEAKDNILALLGTEEPGGSSATARSQEIITALAAIENPSSATPSQPSPAPQAPPTSQSGNPAPPLAPMPNLAPIKSLIVEDEFISRYVIQEFLFPLGTGHIAVNGFEAVLAFKTALVEKQPYDLVCLDIMMPGMDGPTVATEIRRLEDELAEGKHCAIIMTTAVSDPKIVATLLEQQKCDAYLVKPIFREKLYEAIRTCLAVREAQAAQDSL